jgi:hypothetical protein
MTHLLFLYWSWAKGNFYISKWLGRKAKYFVTLKNYMKSVSVSTIKILLEGGGRAHTCNPSYLGG